MTIEIVKRGPSRYRRTCDECGCIFTYQLGDTLYGLYEQRHVFCPQCKKKIRHIGVVEL